MNHVSITGRLTKDFEVKGKIGTGVVAVERAYPFNKDQKGNKVTDFINFRIIGEKPVVNAEKYLLKGTAVEIEGYLFRDNWQDNEKKWHDNTYIMVTKWGFAQGGDRNANNNSNNNSKPSASSSDDSFMNIPEGIDVEVPFD